MEKEHNVPDKHQPPVGYCFSCTPYLVQPRNLHYQNTVDLDKLVCTLFAIDLNLALRILLIPIQVRLQVDNRMLIDFREKQRNQFHRFYFSNFLLFHSTLTLCQGSVNSMVQYLHLTGYIVSGIWLQYHLNRFPDYLYHHMWNWDGLHSQQFQCRNCK